MAWTDNAIMYWSLDGTTWNKITDHNRQPLSISYERFETNNRMVDATMRRYSVAKKRTFALSWTMLPSKMTSSYNGRTGLATVDGGWAGEDIENFYNTNNGAFKVKLRKGADEAKAITDGTLEVVTVMITDFSKTVEKRGVVDLWSLDITLEEV
jgi:hypothetical protein